MRASHEYLACKRFSQHFGSSLPHARQVYKDILHGDWRANHLSPIAERPEVKSQLALAVQPKHKANQKSCQRNTRFMNVTSRDDSNRGQCARAKPNFILMVVAECRSPGQLC